MELRSTVPPPLTVTEILTPCAMIFWLLVWAAVQGLGFLMHGIRPTFELAYFRPLEGMPAAPYFGAVITGIAVLSCLFYWLIARPCTKIGRLLFGVTFVAAAFPVMASVMILHRELPARITVEETIAGYEGISYGDLSWEEKSELGGALWARGLKERRYDGGKGFGTREADRIRGLR